MECAAASKAVGQSHRVAEIGQAGAAAHADMLTQVDHVAGRPVAERRGAAAQLLPGFKQIDLQTMLGEECGGRHTTQPATDDRDLARRVAWRSPRGGHRPFPMVGRPLPLPTPHGVGLRGGANARRRWKVVGKAQPAAIVSFRQVVTEMRSEKTAPG